MAQRQGDNKRKKRRRLRRWLYRNRKVLLRWCVLLAILGLIVTGVAALVRRAHARYVEQLAALEQEGIDLTWEKVSEVSQAGAYTAENFVRDGDFMTYADDRYVSVQGIDVSGYSGDVDWAKVSSAGIRFAILRVGYRGYTEGGIHADSHFSQNAAGCAEQGIPYGVYFFSQAVSETEAEEEARYCLEQIRDLNVELPVFYDPEEAPDSSARTANLSGEQITKNALAFAHVIREAGYEPGLYANRQWQEQVLDMEQFDDVTVWFAGFTSRPESRYHFEFWQYDYQGHVDGMADDIWTDMDIRLVPVS